MTPEPGVTTIPASLRRDVEDLVARYCWAVDERSRDVVASCFTSAGSWVGRVAGDMAVTGPFVGDRVVAAWLASLWSGLESQRRHAFVGLVPCVHGAEDEIVHGRAAFALVSTEAGSSTLEVTGTYAFGFAREREQWRIATMLATFDSPLRSIHQGVGVSPRSG